MKEELPDGSEIRHFEVRDHRALIRWVLSLKGAARIELPAEWRDDAKAMADRIAAAHRDEEQN